MEDELRLSIKADVMFPRIDRDGEKGFAAVGAHPLSVHSNSVYDVAIWVNCLPVDLDDDQKTL